MNVNCNAEPMGDGRNICRPCGLQWNDNEGDKCHRTEQNVQKYVIVDVILKEVQDVSVDQFQKINPLHIVRNNTPDAQHGFLEAEETISEKTVIDLEYFTGQENGQCGGMYLGYNSVVASKLGFMFENFRKQRTAFTHLQDESRYHANEAKAANARVEAQVKTEVLIKEAPFWRRSAFAITGNTEWLVNR
ncbi:MAG: hypothetical protein COB09_18820 [Thalassobium sp.]|nr:MAG: hypothetical protein COB09_18820 [Thalassobium sp.]